MQNYVFVLDTRKQPLNPIHPAHARQLLSGGKAAVFKQYPFTIILKKEVREESGPLRIKFDPGSKITGISIIEDHCDRVIFATELTHRGQQIKDKLESRRALRRGRRNRKTRYRKPRFLNRKRKEGWLPPCVQSRVDNVQTWFYRLHRLAPIGKISMELVRFDTQLMQNPEISGIGYQQGTLAGFEVREYLLEKWGRKCAYCGKQDVPLEVEHIIARSRGGSDRVSNLTLACHDCNQKKNNMPVEEFLKDRQEVLKRVKAQAKAALKDAAAVNVTRRALFDMLKATGLPMEVGTGGRTKFNRVRQGYPKSHWIDAACVGESGGTVFLHPEQKPLRIRAVGRQCRQMCRPDKYGFPRTGAKQSRIIMGFQTGDIVRAIVPKGKKQGTHIGRVAVRATGSFNVGSVQGISRKYCKILHHSDGYSYE